MHIPIVPVLYTDPQTAAHCRCDRCGGERYAPGYRCLRFERGRL